jgi:small subunit ribosomal protein S9
MKKSIQASGKRKRAVARATIKPGKGIIKINNRALSIYTPLMARTRIQEPLILAGPKAEGLNISVTVIGGGFSSQADAARLAIAKALAEHDHSLRDVFMTYDRQLLVADVRRKESAKPGRHGQARAKRQKSYR